MRPDLFWKMRTTEDEEEKKVRYENEDKCVYKWAGMKIWVPHWTRYTYEHCCHEWIFRLFSICFFSALRPSDAHTFTRLKIIYELLNTYLLCIVHDDNVTGTGWNTSTITTNAVAQKTTRLFGAIYCSVVLWLPSTNENANKTISSQNEQR